MRSCDDKYGSTIGREEPATLREERVMSDDHERLSSRDQRVDERWREPIEPVANALRTTRTDRPSALTAQTQTRLAFTSTTRTPPASPNRTSLPD